MLAVFTDVTNTLFYGFVQKSNVIENKNDLIKFYSIQIKVSLYTLG